MFSIATMSLTTRWTTVIHNQPMISRNIPWIITRVRCGLHPHNLNKYAWSFSDYNIGGTVTAKLSLHIPPLYPHAVPAIDAELPTLFANQPPVQLTLTVQFGNSNHVPQALVVNLVP